MTYSLLIIYKTDKIVNAFSGDLDITFLAQPPKSLKLENRVKKVYSNNGDENVDNSRRI